jgi:hypothetical protein
MNLIMQEELDLLTQNCECQDKNFKRMQLICYYMRNEDRHKNYAGLAKFLFDDEGYYRNHAEFAEFLRNEENKNFVIQAISGGKYQDLNDFIRRFLECVQDDWHYMTIFYSAAFTTFLSVSAAVFAVVYKTCCDSAAIFLGIGFASGISTFILTFIIGRYIAKFSKNNPRSRQFGYLDDALDEERENDSLCLYSVNEQSEYFVDEQPEPVCVKDDISEQHS